MDLAHQSLLQIVTMRKCLLGSGWFIPMLVSSVALLVTGCWDEIRYDPTAHPVTPSSQTVVQYDETQPDTASSAEDDREEASNDDSHLPLPTSTDLFAEESPSESEVPAPAISLASTPEERPIEPPTGDDPNWDASENVEVPSSVDESATPVEIDGSPGVEQPEVAEVPTPVDTSTLLAMWRLASKWSLAVGIYGKGYGVDRYGDLWNQAEREAGTLEVDLPPLPQDVEEDDLVTTAATMLLEEAGPELAAEMGQRHSPQHQALGDLAIKTHGLLLIYTPDGREMKSLIAAIRRAAEDSTLPADLWTPLIEQLDARAEFPEIKRAVFQLHKQAEEYLDQLASP